MSQADVKPVSRQENIVVQEYGNEILIYDLTKNKAFSLNETSAIIWQLCDGSKAIADIAESLSGKYNSPISEDFVWLALEQLKKDNLLENAKEVSTDFGGLSRRELIRKVGLATLVTLPVISSLIAPRAANAASGCSFNNNSNLDANGCACNSNSDCMSSCCENVAGNPRTCVSIKPAGSACGNVCECSLSCCINNVCSNRTVTAGNACSNSCQCTPASLACVGGVCGGPPPP